MEKYIIKSTNPIMKFSVDVVIDEEIKNFIVGIDYFSSKVYFEDKSLEGVDYSELENSILKSIMPKPVLEPELVPQEIIKQINDIRVGAYESNQLQTTNF